MRLAIGDVIFKLRKEKGVTQEEVATTVGVSVAAVSKWESKNSYPDIELLPSIARYFNTTIDKLLNFEIDISNEEVMEIANKCSEKIENSTLEEGIKFCEDYIREYPNNLFLKFRVASLYMVYFVKAESEEDILSLSKKAILLFEQSALSEDIKLSQTSNYILSSLYSMNGEDERAEEVLLKIPKSDIEVDNMLASLYSKQERFEEAKKLIQEDLVKKLSSIIMSLTSYIGICKKENNREFAKEILFKQRELIKLFNIESIYLAPNSLLYSEISTEDGEFEKAFAYIKEFIDGMNNSKTNLSENKLFDKIEFSEPIQSKEYIKVIIKKSLEENQVFEALKDLEEYKNIINSI